MNYYESFLKPNVKRGKWTHFIIIFPIQFILSVFALFLYFIAKVIRPTIHVRVGKLSYVRMGHLASNTEVYLRRRAKEGIPACEWHFFVSGRPANNQLFKMICRKIPVLKSQVAVWMYERLRLYKPKSELWIDLPEPDRFFQVGDIPAQLSFTPQEEERGKKLLESMGIKPGVPFVCFHVRDKAYLDRAHSHRSREKWAYQDHRDCNLKNYLPAINYLASLGIYILRMGYIVEQELENDNPYIIDYATQHRTDFGDIYLSAHCKFFLSSDGGMSSIPWIFNVPVAYANGVPPLGAAGWRPTDVYITKKLWSRSKQCFLTSQEILDRGIDRWFQSQKFEEANIDVVENSEDEILSLVKELNARIDGTWEETEDDRSLQMEFQKIFPPGHRNYGNRSRIGAKFLRQNNFLISGEATYLEGNVKVS